MKRDTLEEDSTQGIGNTSEASNPDEDEYVTDPGPIAYMGQMQSPGLTKWQLDPKEELERFEYSFLKNYIKGESGRWTPRQVKVLEPEQMAVLQKGGSIPVEDYKYIFIDMPPKANDMGVSTLSGLLASVVSPNTPLADLTNLEVLENICDTLFTITITIYLHYDDFEIDPKDFEDIYAYMRNIIIAAYSRGRDGRTLKFLSRIFSEKQSETPQQKQGMFPSIKL